MLKSSFPQVLKANGMITKLTEIEIYAGKLQIIVSRRNELTK